MAGEWKSTTLGNCVRFISGGTPSKSNKEFWGGNVPWVSAKDMKSWWVNSSEDKLTALGAAQANWIAPTGTPLILVRGMTLHNEVPIVRVRQPSAFNQDVKAVVAKPGINDSYVPYLLAGLHDTLLDRVDSAGHGTGRLTSEVLTNLEVSIPGAAEQHAISDFLTAIDDKIDLIRQIAATLEEMARALFKSWFVDFDPVRAKAEGRNTGLPAAIAALFPDTFDDNGLPTSWRSGSLDDIAETNSESWKASSRPEEIEYVDLSNCKWGNIDGTTRYRWEEAPSRARRVARAGDTIFGTVRPGNGSYAFVGREGLTVSTGFAVLRPKESIFREMVFLAVTHIDNIHWLEQLAAGHGGTYPAVNPDKVSATTMNVPCKKVVAAFSSTTAHMIDRIESLKQESAELEQLRGTLMPKLLSGELRVADAETVIAVA